jgi:hypothetical protein
VSTAKPSARFLPTLTEVVQPPAAITATADQVLELTQRATVLLEARMVERLEAIVKVQARNVLNGLRDEMQLAIADALKQALRERE